MKPYVEFPRQPELPRRRVKTSIALATQAIKTVWHDIIDEHRKKTGS